MTITGTKKELLLTILDQGIAVGYQARANEIVNKITATKLVNIAQGCQVQPDLTVSASEEIIDRNLKLITEKKDSTDFRTSTIRQ